MKSFIYQMLRLINDLNAISKGKVAQRAGRKTAGRAFGRFLR